MLAQPTTIGRVLAVCVVLAGVAAYWCVLPAAALATHTMSPAVRPTMNGCPSGGTLPNEFTSPDWAFWPGNPAGALSDWRLGTGGTESLAITAEPSLEREMVEVLTTLRQSDSRHCNMSRNFLWGVENAVQLLRHDVDTANARLLTIANNTDGGGGVTPAAAITQLEETLMFLAGLVVAGIVAWPFYRVVIP